MTWKRFRKGAALSLFAALSATAIAYGAGNYLTYPMVGNPSFCASTVTGAGGFTGTTGQGQSTTGSICAATIPGGEPALTGNELVPADTPQAGGQTGALQTETIPVNMLLSGSGDKNVLVGGDFQQNLWQRGVTPLTSVSAATAVMSADGWFVYSLNSTLSVSKVTASADQSLGSISAAFRLIHPSGLNTSEICMGQLIPDKESFKFLGQRATFQFNAFTGSGMSASATSTISAYIAYHTAADSTVPLTNTQTFGARSISGFAFAAGVSIQLGAAYLSPGPYSITTAAVIPTTATGVGVEICYTPNVAGVASDYIDIANAMLEVQPSAASGQGSSSAPSPFQRRPLETEWQLEQARFYRIAETTVSGQLYPATVFNEGGNVQWIQFPFPTTMRITPSYGTANFPGGFEITPTGAAGTWGAVGSVSGLLNGTNPNSGFVKGTATYAAVSSVAAAVVLTSSGAGTGIVDWVAEP